MLLVIIERILFLFFFFFRKYRKNPNEGDLLKEKALIRKTFFYALIYHKISILLSFLFFFWKDNISILDNWYVLVGSSPLNWYNLWWLYKRSRVQSLPTLKTDWCLGLMIKELSSRADIIDWNFLKKKKDLFLVQCHKAHQ